MQNIRSESWSQNVIIAIMRHCIGVGVVVLEHSGKVLSCFVRRINGMFEPDYGSDVRFALGVRHRLGGVVCELDCLEVCKA